MESQPNTTDRDPEAIRVMSWNVGSDSDFEQMNDVVDEKFKCLSKEIPAHRDARFREVFNAIKPGIVLLQEVPFAARDALHKERLEKWLGQDFSFVNGITRIPLSLGTFPNSNWWLKLRRLSMESL